MTNSIVVVGAGGFGREVIDVIDAVNAQVPTWKILGVVDDAPSAEHLGRLERRNIRCLGTIDDHLAASEPHYYVIGIGSPRIRRSIAGRFDAAGWAAATVVHPTVTCGFDVRVGAGAVLCAGVRLTTNIVLGRHVHLNLNVTVGHDTRIDDFVSVNPLASISGDCVIQSDVTIGVAGVLLNQVTVRRGATVGGSACVVRDVPEGVVVKGVPAR